VELFTHDKEMNQYALLNELLRLDKKGLRALYLHRMSREQIRSLEPFLAGTRALRRTDDIVGTTLRPMMRTLVNQVDQRIDSRSFALMQAAILHAANDRALELFLSRFLDATAKSSDATAWVCSEDKTALAAISRLRALGKKVPADISVVGFDNWRDAHEHQLSTYDFNMPGMVQQALLMIADPRTLRSKPVISDVDGYVVERRTTKR
jgi:hypothetical protein